MRWPGDGDASAGGLSPVEGHQCDALKDFGAVDCIVSAINGNHPPGS